MNELVEIYEFNEPGYKPLVDYQSWRVAMLRYIESLHPEHIDNLECHWETDEVFVLLQGKCLLFIGVPQDQRFEDIIALDMEALKLYNIPKGVYHSHTLSLDASVLIIENQNTGAANSHQVRLTESQRTRIIDLSLAHNMIPGEDQ